jgi:hypothetical protein
MTRVTLHSRLDRLEAAMDPPTGGLTRAEAAELVRLEAIMAAQPRVDDMTDQEIEARWATGFAVPGFAVPGVDWHRLDKLRKKARTPEQAAKDAAYGAWLDTLTLDELNIHMSTMDAAAREEATP